MRYVVSVFLLLSTVLTGQSQRESFKSGGPRSFEIVPLETVSETSANASIGDLNGDGYPDIVLAKGRHWEVPSRMFFGDGKGNFWPGPALPGKATKTYSASLADMTKRGHLDMVLSNDEPDPNWSSSTMARVISPWAGLMATQSGQLETQRLGT
jgi:FG-GAP-like repeat